MFYKSLKIKTERKYNIYKTFQSLVGSTGKKKIFWPKIGTLGLHSLHNKMKI